MIYVHFDLYKPFITPGSVPRVLDEPVVQVGVIIMAITDNEYAMINRVEKLYVFIAIGCIEDTFWVMMYGIIGRNYDANRLLKNGSL